jgi:hypothetical protein
MKNKCLLCVDNRGYEVSLELRKLDGKFPDKEAERHNPFRPADESGEDSLYPSEFFAPGNIPVQTKSRLNEKPP